MSELKLSIDLDDYYCYECGNGAEKFINDIMDRIALHILDSCYGMSQNCEQMVNKKVQEIIKTIEKQVETKVVDFMKKESIQTIADSVSQKLETAFEKSNTYRELKNGLNIESDKVMSSGIREMVRDAVAAEVKNIFNNNLNRR